MLPYDIPIFRFLKIATRKNHEIGINWFQIESQCFTAYIRCAAHSRKYTEIYNIKFQVSTKRNVFVHNKMSLFHYTHVVPFFVLLLVASRFPDCRKWGRKALKMNDFSLVH